LEFSSDGRWVLAASADGCVRVWDVPAARLLQTVRFGGFDKGNVVTGMSLSPAMDMLATTHEGRRGVYLWANAAVYAPSATGSAKEAETTEAGADENSADENSADENSASGDGPPTVTVRLPRLHAESADAEDIVLGSAPKPVEWAKDEHGLSAKQSEDVTKLGPMAQTAAKAPTPAPAAPGLATMALLPKSQWMGLLHLETIRERNKPSVAVQKPEAAPFFLPTTASLAGDAVFDLDKEEREKDADENEKDDPDENSADDASRILTKKTSLGGDVENALLRLIRRGAANAAAAEEQALADAKKGVLPNGAGAGRKKPQKRGVSKRLHAAFETAAVIEDESDHYHEVLLHLRSKGPSALDAEIRSLGPWDVATMTDAEADELGDVLDFFAAEIPSGRNFELLNALLAHFLRVHGSAIRERESLRMRAETVRAAARRAWGSVDALMQEVRCALGFFGGQHGQ
jgi:U3 small nucleolar RNA-associated protein 21